MQFTLFDGSQPFKVNKPIRLIELFSGYGSQALALKYLGIPFEHWKICEWAVKSIQAYKDAHFNHDNTDYSKELTKEELFDYLTAKGISANYNEPMTYEQVKRLGETKARIVYNNIMATHNLVNIQQAKGEDFEICDTDKYCYIMTYSFPCQDLSSAGLCKGMGKGSGTRSGMLWEVERILDELEELPQVLLMENVPEVIGTNNIKHFAKWLEKLESLGYKNKWQVLNGKDYGIPQNRERCFMVSILGDYYYEFPEQQKLEIFLDDICNDELSDVYCKIKNIDLSNDSTYYYRKLIETFDNNNYKLPKYADLYNARPINDNIAGTLSTSCGNNCGCGSFCKIIGNSLYKLTPKECFRLMGVKDEDFEKIAKNQSNASLYHLAGDSIIVNVLMAIFNQII